jgi:hypothetical protein
LRDVIRESDETHGDGQSQDDGNATPAGNDPPQRFMAYLTIDNFLNSCAGGVDPVLAGVQQIVALLHRAVPDILTSPIG